MTSPTPDPRSARRPPATARAAQRGITLFGLVFWALLIAFVAYIVVRTLPTVNEYVTIKRTVEKVAAAAPSTVSEVRLAFDRQKEIEYSIASISGKDLQISKENDKIVIAFAYEKEVPIAGPVFLLLKYEGRARQP